MAIPEIFALVPDFPADGSTQIRIGLPNILLVISALVIVVAKFGASGLTKLFTLGLVAILLWSNVGVRSGGQRNDNPSESASMVTTVDRDAVAVGDEELSTEEMWDHFTESRIPLGDEEVTGEEVTSSEGEDSEEEESTTNTPVAKQQPRPEWVNNPPESIGNVYRVVVSSGPYKDVRECHRALDPIMREVVQQRTAQLTEGNASASTKLMGLSQSFILSEICHQEWVETTEASFGEMKNVHVLMEFDAAVDDQIRIANQEYQRRTRITEVGSVAGVGFGSLALLFGLLKVDTWTKGYYTKRLFLGVPAAIIAVVALLV